MQVKTMQKRVIYFLAVFFCLCLSENGGSAQTSLRLYLCNPVNLPSFPDLRESPETSGNQYEWLLYQGHGAMIWDGYILPYNISGNSFRVHIYCAEATPFSQQLFYALISIGGRTVLLKYFYVSGDYYQYYPSPFSFVSDSVISAVAGEEVKLYVGSSPTSGVSGVRWGTGVDSYIEIPGRAAVSVDDKTKNPVATEFTLSQNYPNPFNPTTSIKYQIPTVAHVTLKVFDVLGREVASLVNEKKDPGYYRVQFDAAALPSGMYFYRLQAGSFGETKKMLVLR